MFYCKYGNKEIFLVKNNTHLPDRADVLIIFPSRSNWIFKG